MSTGVVLLFIIGLLIYFGTAQRVLDHLYLSDSAALIIIFLMIIGSFYNIPVSQDPLISFNIGGVLIPLIIVGYIFYKNDTINETFQAIFASIAATGGIFLISMIFSEFGEGRDIIDPLYLFAMTGGISGYIFGRSRRGAFIAGILGFIFYTLINSIGIFTGQIPGQVIIGGAGIFDSIVISGFLALLLAELIGETRESIQKGEN